MTSETNQFLYKPPMTTISLRMPENLVDELKEIAPRLGFAGYQPLIRAYISQGLKADRLQLESKSELSALVGSLRRQGVQERVIGSALAEAKAVYGTSPSETSGAKEQDLSWLAFISATYGAFADEPLERPAQGEFEEREQLG